MLNPPEGFTNKYDNTLWNVGYLFRRSSFYEVWLDCEYQFTVRPEETPEEAYFWDCC